MSASESSRDVCQPLLDMLTQARQLNRRPIEPPIIYLQNPSSDSPLAACVVAPPAINSSDVELVVPKPWCDPFRLLAVVVRLPAAFVSLDPDAVAFQFALYNMAAEATLELPCSSTPAFGSDNIQLCALQTRIRDGGDGRSVQVDIAVPSDTSLSPAACVVVRVSFGGSPRTLRIPATGHIHTAICNHSRKPEGAVFEAARTRDVVALEAALAAGGSTEETENVAVSMFGSELRTDATALNFSVRGGHTEAVRVLLAAGADVNTRDAVCRGCLKAHVRGSHNAQAVACFC